MGLLNKCFIVLLSYSGPLTTKCVSLNNEPWMIRRTLFYLDPVELNCYLFMVSVDKCSGSCNAVDDSMNICVKQKTEMLKHLI